MSKRKAEIKAVEMEVAEIAAFSKCILNTMTLIRERPKRDNQQL